MAAAPSHSRLPCPVCDDAPLLTRSIHLPPRHRVLAAWSTARGGCTLLHLASYPLLPRARWPDAVFGPYTILVSTHTLTTTLIYCALDLFMGVSCVPLSAQHGYRLTAHTGTPLVRRVRTGAVGSAHGLWRRRQ